MVYIAQNLRYEKEEKSKEEFPRTEINFDSTNMKSLIIKINNRTYEIDKFKLERIIADLAKKEVVK